jgi:hypothetical protein
MRASLFTSSLAAAILLVPFSGTALAAGAEPGAEGKAVSGTAPSPGPLDGKTFVTQSGEKGKQASNKDTFVFRDGRFLSEGCTPWGFGDAPYRHTVEGDAIRFHAETRSPTHGNMVWDGIVRGDAVEATNTWTRQRWYWNIKREYWYRGQLKK